MASYSDEEKINYVILLHYRYNGQCDTMGRAMGISRHSLKSWKQDFLIEAMSLMRVYDTPEQPYDDTGEAPTYDDLIRSAFIRLGETLKTERDPAKTASALFKLIELKSKYGKGEEGDKEGIYEEINALLGLGKKNIKRD